MNKKLYDKSRGLVLLDPKRLLSLIRANQFINEEQNEYMFKLEKRIKKLEEKIK
jgi:hypothetical protein